MIWNHPGRIKPGQTLDPMISSYDYFPTILDYCGVKAPQDKKRVGRSYAGLLNGERRNWRNRLYFEYSNVRAVRTENLKLVMRTKEFESEMFDLEADPSESRSVFNDPKYAGQRAALQKDLEGWFAQNGAPPLEEWRTTVRQHLTGYSN